MNVVLRPPTVDTKLAEKTASVQVRAFLREMSLERRRIRAKLAGWMLSVRRSMRRKEAIRAEQQNCTFHDILDAAVKKEVTRIAGELHAESLRYGLAIAEVVASQLACTEDSLEKRLSQSIGQIVPRQILKLHVAFGDFEVISKLIPHIPRITPDRTLARGEVEIHCTSGTVRLSWRDHLKQIAERKLGSPIYSAHGTSYAA